MLKEHHWEPSGTYLKHGENAKITTSKEKKLEDGGLSTTLIGFGL
jgi:hypothetical protein